MANATQIKEQRLGSDLYAAYENGYLVLTVKTRSSVRNIIYINQEEQRDLERFCQAIRMTRAGRDTNG
jgi:hypothetical protein